MERHGLGERPGLRCAPSDLWKPWCDSRMARMADEGGESRRRMLRFRHVEEAADTYEVMSADQLEEDSARWVDLAQAGTHLALAVAKGDTSALTEPAGALVRALLDVEDAQSRLLKSIDDNVRLLRDGPFKTGRLYLREAHRLADSPERSEKFVERGAGAVLRGPRGSQRSPWIGLRSRCTSPGRDSAGATERRRHWLGEAYAKAAFQARELADETGNTKVIRGRGIAQAATAYLTMGTSAGLPRGQEDQADPFEQPCEGGLARRAAAGGLHRHPAHRHRRRPDGAPRVGADRDEEGSVRAGGGHSLRALRHAPTRLKGGCQVRHPPLNLQPTVRAP